MSIYMSQNQKNTYIPKQVEQPSPLTYVPKEIICKIASYFPINSSDLSNIRLSCKRFKKIIADQTFLFSVLKEITHLNHKDVLDLQKTFHTRYRMNLSFAEIVKRCSKLETLDLSYSKVEDIEIKRIGDFNPKLTALILDHCVKLKNPDFTGFIPLKRLSLKKCAALSSPILRGLISLKKISINDCISLEKLLLDDLSDLEIVNIEKNGNLKEISARNCKLLKGFYASFFNFTKLNFEGCELLKTIFLNGCRHLTEINLLNCINLKNFTVVNCTQLNHLPLFDRHLDSLETIEIYNLNLDFIKLDQLPCLKILTIDGCPNLLHLSLNKDSSLQKIQISKCHSLNTLMLKNQELTSLKFMEIMHCKSLFSINLNGLSALQKIFLRKTPITRLDLEQEKLTSLRKLHLSSLPNLSYLNIINLSLKDLKIHKCANVKELRYSDICQNFLKLRINNSHSDSTTTLKKLELKFTEKLTPDQIDYFVHALNLPILEILKITQNLKALDLSKSSIDMPTLFKIAQLCPKLETLNLNFCEGLTEFTIDESHFKFLKYLDLSDCTNLKKITIKNLTDLQSLNANRCKGLETFEMMNIFRLNYFSCEDCPPFCKKKIYIDR